MLYCFIALSQIIGSDRKLFSSVLRKSFVESGIREIGHQVNSLLKSESWYSKACKHFTGEKSLSNFVQNKKEFIESQELIIGFDPVTEKNDTVQYVSILRTLRLILSHEDVLEEVVKGTTEHTEGVVKSYNDSEMCRENVLFASDETSLQLISIMIFNVVSPLGIRL